jgi:hypothetical protein
MPLTHSIIIIHGPGERESVCFSCRTHIASWKAAMRFFHVRSLNCPPALGGPHLHERPRAQPVLPIGQAGGEGAHARRAARHVDAYLHSGGALHPATTTLSTGYRACSRAAGWSARLCALPHLLPRGVAGVRPLSQSGHSPSWPCPKKWHFSDMAALADDVRCRGDTVAKVPKSPAADFPLKDETSDNRRSMQPQTHSRNRLCVWRTAA